VVLRSPVPLPFTTSQNCYRVLCEEEDSINNTVSILGFLDIKCHRDADTFIGILEEALATIGFKGAVKKRIKNATKGMPSHDETVFTKNVRIAFKDTPEICRYVNDAVQGLSGWFTKETRTLGAGLLCMGFHDRDLVIRELALQDVGAEVAAWFRPLGDPDPEWKSVDNNYESFARLLSSFKGRHGDFLKSVDAMIAAAPAKFYCRGTRPMALRGLGALDKGVFTAYCLHKLNVNMNNAGDLIAADNDVFVAQDDVALGRSLGASCDVNGVPVQRCAANALRSLAILNKHNMVLLEGEFDVAGEPRALFDSNVVRTGVRGAIREVHVFCALSKICFVFDNQGSRSTDEAVRGFLCGKQRCRAKVYFRDAHIMSCNTFAHIVSALARRVDFETITMTHRFQHDRDFRSPFWCFMRHLRPAAFDCVGVRPAALDRVGSIYDAEQLSGICVVPAAKDASSALAAHDPDLSFCINPPLFGTVTRADEYTCDIKVYSSAKLVRVHMLDATRGCKNVFACHKTNNGGFLVPASAFLAVKSAVTAHVNLLLPVALDEPWKRELAQMARVIAEKVTIIDVDRYDLAADSVDADDIKMNQIANTIIDSC